MKIMSIVGARPQFVKMAPLCRALEGEPSLRHFILHTGQHYDEELSRVFFRELSIPAPDVNLGAGSASHAVQTAEMMEGVEAVLEERKPDFVLVYGDTNSTLAGAMAAAKVPLPIGHVEAGLRSFNREMPEEVNRVVADRLSDLLFCPTRRAVDNLRAEGIERGVHRVGDVMLDALRFYGEQGGGIDLLGRYRLEEGGYLLLTVHREENTRSADRLRGFLRAVAGRGERVVFPVHPRTRKMMEASGLRPGEGVLLLPPLPYLEMITLVRGARLVLTDSGGVQKEACLLETPCVTLRDETEWEETVEAGWNTLAGTSEEGLRGALEKPRGPVRPVREFGDGRAAEKIVEILKARGI